MFEHKPTDLGLQLQKNTSLYDSNHSLKFTVLFAVAFTKKEKRRISKQAEQTHNLLLQQHHTCC